jgi:FixJ family two-component response regulator
MSRGQVYVVDDDLFIRQSTCDLVESVGLQGKAFGSAEAFLAAYSEDIPTVVVVDVRLPGTGGLQLQASLAARKATAPVIFVTRYGDAWTAVQAMKAVPSISWKRPIKEKELLNAVQAAMRFHEQLIRKKVSWRLLSGGPPDPARGRLICCAPMPRRSRSDAIGGRTSGNDPEPPANA